MAKKAKKAEAPKTTAQQLGSLIKSARDIMRKDKGLNGDLDRLPLLTWIMFLKFLDDREKLEETRAQIAGKKYKPAIEPPYRWRDWAANKQGVTGDELMAFVNQEEAARPDGSRGAGLLAHLRGLQSTNGDRRRDVIATVFDGVINRMISGYLMRDVVNLVDGIHFDSTDEIHTLGHMYESMLREMRDAAGDSGEFYTPRPVVKFMVAVTNPQLGEQVLDPACGTGGFLAETFTHLERECRTVADRKTLQERTILGGEAKPLPYLLGQMNLLLHGLDSPQIAYGNSLATKLTEIGHREQVDVILTNPPFGGEEEAGIKNNFPADMQTSETALLFLQLIMRRLKQPERNNGKPGRAGVVVPNGTLYAAGIGARVRAKLLNEFNLHTVVRLPKGVFEPYADIPTNILFFDRSGATQDVWFYEHPLPPHRAKLRAPCYSQTEPLEFEEFCPLMDWWSKREETSQAWRVSVDEIRSRECNLDLKNPNKKRVTKINLGLIANKVTTDSNAVTSSLSHLREGLLDIAKLPNGEPVSLTSGVLGDFCNVQKGKSPTMKTLPGAYEFIVTAAEPRTADHYDFDAAAVCIPLVSSTGHGHAALHRIHFANGKFALASIMAAVIVKDGVKLNPKFLYYYLWRYKDDKLVSLMAGTANTSLTVSKLESVPISFPQLKVQNRVVHALDSIVRNVREVKSAIKTVYSHTDVLISDLLCACVAHESSCP